MNWEQESGWMTQVVDMHSISALRAYTVTMRNLLLSCRGEA